MENQLGICFFMIPEKCNEIFGSIMTNTQLTENQKLDKWSNYKNTCSHDSMYYLGRAAIYSIKDISYAINYIDFLSKSGVISYTKEVFYVWIEYVGEKADNWISQTDTIVKRVQKTYDKICDKF